MNDSIIDVTYLQLAFAYVFVILILYIMRRRKIKREKELLIASLRMTVQLIAVGFILTFIFDNPHPLITLSIILIMVIFAIFTIVQKFKKEMTTALKKVVVLSMFVGTIPVLIYFSYVVIGVKPYYNPQYFIPLTGMIIGNSMTGISLGLKTMMMRFTKQKEEVIEALILGASPKDASSNIINDAFDAAILPTINSMLGMGIIFLPGMMTGQILSGVSPATAVLYQIAIMLAILGGVSLSTYLSLIFGYNTYFNKQDQLQT